MGLMFDGIDLRSTYNFVVTKIDGRGSPPVFRNALDMPRVDGQIEVEAKLKSRNLVISGYVYGSDAATKKDNLIKLISQAYSQEKKLTFPDTNRTIYVKLAGDPIVVGPVGPILNASAYEITFNFVALDPFFYADEHNETGWGYIKVNADAPTYLMSPRSQILKREPKIELYPVTIVNLVGKYGGFWQDSDGDGIADGWRKAGGTAITYSYDATDHAQLFDCSYNNVYLIKDLNLEEHTYAHIFLLKKTEAVTTILCIGLGRNTSYSSVNRVFVGDSEYNTSTYTRICKTITASAADATLSFTNIYMSGFAGTPWKAKIKEYMFIDLTIMGELPPPLKAFFNYQVSKWTDLATTTNIAAVDGRTQSGHDWLAELLPYTDSVTTVGYSFVDGQLSVVTENKGKNLLNDSWLPSMYSSERGYYSTVWGAKIILGSTKKVVADVWAGATGVGQVVEIVPNKTYYLSATNIGEQTINLRVTERPTADYNAFSSYPYYKTLSFSSSNPFVWLSIDQLYPGILDVEDIILSEQSTEYSPPRNGKIEFNTELWALEGIYEKIFEDNGQAKKIKYFVRETKITDSSGNFTLSGYASGKCIVINGSTGEVKILDASSTVSTGWASTEVTVIYRISTPTIENLDYDGELLLQSGTNYITLPDLAVASISGNRKYLEG